MSCNICGWNADDFEGPRHSERAICVKCGSIARDRYLFHCWTSRTHYRAGQVVVETSPRLRGHYRDVMTTLAKYIPTDHDMTGSLGNTFLDLQQIDLPDSSIDLLLSAHVLEHVPDTARALSEIYRTVRPGGTVFLMVPLLQGKTSPPPGPEYHEEQSLVFWRFGWDLTDRLRDAGFIPRILVTQDFFDALAARRRFGIEEYSYDAQSVIDHASDYLDQMEATASRRLTRLLGLEAGNQLVVWEGRKPH